MAALDAMRLGLPPSEQSSGALGESSGVATFISKVWKIVEKPEYDSLISWSDSGKTFVVWDYSNFAKEVLPLYFKHSNFNSFVRQLNLYGFRKVTNPEKASLAKAQTNEPVEFWHTNFRKGHPELINLVQRRSVSSRTGMEEKNPQLSKVMNDIHQMKGRQENIANVLDSMKRENQHLRHEVSMLKEKHIRQQKVLNKIIQFLVHMVYKGKLPPGGRRRSARLMLMDAESQPSPPKRMRTLSESSSTRLTDGSDLQVTSDYTVQSPSSVAVQPSPLLQLLQSPPSSPTQTPSSIVPDLSATAASITPTYTLSSTSPFTLPPSLPALPSTSTADTGPPEGNLLLETDSNSSFQIPSELLMTEFPINPPPPPSLISNPPPERMRITDHLDHQQQGIDALPDLLSGQFSMDPSVISEFISSESAPCPEYDIIDTARLLESLTTDNLHVSSVPQSNALVPISQSSIPTPLMSTQQLPSTEDGTFLRELLDNDDD